MIMTGITVVFHPEIVVCLLKQQNSQYNPGTVLAQK